MNSLMNIFVFLLVASPLFGRKDLEDHMIEAVRHCDIERLQALMKKFDRAHMRPEEKKVILGLAQAACTDVINATKMSSLVASKHDLVSTFTGGLAAIWGVSCLIRCKDELLDSPRIPDQPWLIAYAAGSGVMTLLGAYACVKGIRKSYQQKKHDIARKIDDYLTYCKHEIDFPSKNEFLLTPFSGVLL